MSRFVAFLLATLCHAGVWAQAKPDLGGSIFMAPVECPDKKEDTCVLVTKAGNYYIFRGNIIGKEEYIWQVDSEALTKAKEADFNLPLKYIKLVWSKHST